MIAQCCEQQRGQANAADARNSAAAWAVSDKWGKCYIAVQNMSELLADDLVCATALTFLVKGKELREPELDSIRNDVHSKFLIPLMKVLSVFSQSSRKEERMMDWMIPQNSNEKLYRLVYPLGPLIFRKRIQEFLNSGKLPASATLLLILMYLPRHHEGHMREHRLTQLMQKLLCLLLRGPKNALKASSTELDELAQQFVVSLASDSVECHGASLHKTTRSTIREKIGSKDLYKNAGLALLELLLAIHLFERVERFTASESWQHAFLIHTCSDPNNADLFDMMHVPGEMSIDHIWPQCDGSNHELGNLASIAMKHNSAKGGRAYLRLHTKDERRPVMHQFRLLGVPFIVDDVAERQTLMVERAAELLGLTDVDPAYNLLDTSNALAEVQARAETVDGVFCTDVLCSPDGSAGDTLKRIHKEGRQSWVFILQKKAEVQGDCRYAFLSTRSEGVLPLQVDSSSTDADRAMHIYSTLLDHLEGSHGKYRLKVVHGSAFTLNDAESFISSVDEDEEIDQDVSMPASFKHLLPAAGDISTIFSELHGFSVCDVSGAGNNCLVASFFESLGELCPYDQVASFADEIRRVCKEQIAELPLLLQQELEPGMQLRPSHLVRFLRSESKSPSGGSLPGYFQAATKVEFIVVAKWVDGFQYFLYSCLDDTFVGQTVFNMAEFMPSTTCIWLVHIESGVFEEWDYGHFMGVRSEEQQSSQDATPTTRFSRRSNDRATGVDQPLALAVANSYRVCHKGMQNGSSPDEDDKWAGRLRIKPAQDLHSLLTSLRGCEAYKNGTLTHIGIESECLSFVQLFNVETAAREVDRNVERSLPEGTVLVGYVEPGKFRGLRAVNATRPNAQIGAIPLAPAPPDVPGHSVGDDHFAAPTLSHCDSSQEPDSSQLSGSRRPLESTNDAPSSPTSSKKKLKRERPAAADTITEKLFEGLKSKNCLKDTVKRHEFRAKIRKYCGKSGAKNLVKCKYLEEVSPIFKELLLKGTRTEQVEAFTALMFTKLYRPTEKERVNDVQEVLEVVPNNPHKSVSGKQMSESLSNWQHGVSSDGHAGDDTVENNVGPNVGSGPGGGEGGGVGAGVGDSGGPGGVESGCCGGSGVGGEGGSAARAGVDGSGGQF
eukprot:CAMPEP_0170754194 /NCGR_PEP_ID=MMETSP0437-20130122/12880_1 /TAXON_ID=0 /ORGANISM="Sexangularia sp." /LENGTH=1118 /DNA_ID=CAMNT_0011093331 /DNA_START=99 /DNA_END=3455 /DNA_ORIENTATION=-